MADIVEKLANIIAHCDKAEVSLHFAGLAIARCDVRAADEPFTGLVVRLLGGTAA
ncbi:hypothetical protein IB238_06750 [Rhizobium sp. ARZ01]|uniref:hypothetical protein n=1 Tax=Rhizobium sp. ARZ01 TaxID=2769313 RepID=UPI0017830A0F|nr:hypothetical protein [Rhizobium sp. ARZ01]MBD9372324.1 hypothetical protein [Rhizobium sp. ARZ01]